MYIIDVIICDNMFVDVNDNFGDVHNEFVRVNNTFVDVHNVVVRVNNTFVDVHNRCDNM